MKISASPNFLRRSWALALLGLLQLAALLPASAAEISADDKKQIAQVMTDYREGWLADDKTKVLGLLTDDMTIIPSGQAPISGKKLVTEFWFPASDASKTSIDHYEIDLLEIGGSGELGYTLENGRLTWSYEKDGRKVTTSQESSEITLFRKVGRAWKMTRRIWTDRNVKRTDTSPAKKAN